MCYGHITISIWIYVCSLYIYIYMIYTYDIYMYDIYMYDIHIYIYIYIYIYILVASWRHVICGVQMRSTTPRLNYQKCLSI